MGLINRIRKWINHDLDTRKSLARMSNELIRINDFVDRIYYHQQMLCLRDKCLYSKEYGVTQNKYIDRNVIISLTTFGRRINNVYLTIESIMQGSVLPNKIILWLAENEFNPATLPQTLLNQQKRGLQIEFCKDIKSYKKLIPALKMYPDSLLLTIDDDVIYDFDLLECFLRKHNEFPGVICASRFRKVCYKQNRDVETYINWEDDENIDFSPLLFPIGVGGVLYPPNSLNDKVFDEDIFMSLCPYADDVWFFAMARLNGTNTVRVRGSNPHGFLYDLPSSGIDALSTQNINPKCCRNDTQINAVFEKYKIKECLSNMLLNLS